MCCRRAHPRVCGENPTMVAWRLPAAGSSPRVRGKPGFLRPLLPEGGLIPACAGKTVFMRPVWSILGAHPRVCGENSSSTCPTPPPAGSSPRVRGKRRRARGSGSRRRLIPACAGKTSPSAGHTSCRSAHPRVCGENCARRRALTCSRGSSPRVRGKLSLLVFDDGMTGLIPACAGKTSSPASARALRRAHPRVCGENLGFTFEDSVALGSSPRVRGKRAVGVLDGDVDRLIPACAGKTRRPGGRRSGVSAHPRVCGENNSGAGSGRRGRGSSPRVRGKRSRRRSSGPAVGLIPACAGKTDRQFPLFVQCWAHPRVCGENRARLARAPAQVGSSPRVRGKRTHTDEDSTLVGLIPACAGKTATLWRPWPPSTAHPRVCGENFVPWVFVSMLWGSSPRVRGKQYDYVHSLGTPGLIPACAGKTPRTPRSCTRAWAHPRVCGENSMYPCSSPVTRWLIPACAGKTFRRSTHANVTRAHPRVCGENPFLLIGMARPEGSSPRVRGKPESTRRNPAPRRLIPACAGKTYPAVV